MYYYLGITRLFHSTLALFSYHIVVPLQDCLSSVDALPGTCMCKQLFSSLLPSPLSHPLHSVLSHLPSLSLSLCLSLLFLLPLLSFLSFLCFFFLVFFPLLTLPHSFFPMLSLSLPSGISLSYLCLYSFSAHFPFTLFSKVQKWRVLLWVQNLL